MNIQTRLITFSILFLISISVFGQVTPSTNISELIKMLDSMPTEKQVDQLKISLISSDTLEYSLAVSILFKYFPNEYKTQMINAFAIPYLDTKRATVTKFYKTDEVLQIDKEIAKFFDKKYRLKMKERDAIYILYTFIEYRKRNVWTYQSEQFSIPTTIAIRGGYLKWLLEETMDYKKFISEITATEKTNFEKKPTD